MSTTFLHPRVSSRNHSRNQEMCCLWNIDVTVSVLRQILVSFHFVSFNELWTNHSSINIIGNQIITLILCLSSSSSNMKRHFELLMWNIRFNRWIKCLSCCFWMFYIVIYVYQHVFVWFPRTVPRILRSRIVDFCCFGIVFLWWPLINQRKMWLSMKKT